MFDLNHFTITNELVKRIHDEIVCGNFVPGERLRLRDLAEQFGVSTQPIRLALTELEAIGIVTSEPRKGSMVIHYSAAELDDLYDIRATLESRATRDAAPHIKDNTITELKNLIQEMDAHEGDVAELVRLNTAFHMTIYQVSGRKYLCELILSLRQRTSHYLHAYMINQGKMAVAQEEHRAIVAALVDGKPDIAAEEMAQHVSRAGTGIKLYVQNQEHTAKE